jgi:hypothetical protein
MHLIVDSTGLKFHGPGEWRVEKHGTKTRRSCRKLHIGLDTDIGETIAAELTGYDVDDGSQVGPLPEQIAGPIASFTGDSAYDTTRMRATKRSRADAPGSSTFFVTSQAVARSNSTLGRSVPVQHRA